jgi:hypothetical protein
MVVRTFLMNQGAGRLAVLGIVTWTPDPDPKALVELPVKAAQVD